MKRRRIKKNKNNGAPKWMVTYSDMVTLILVFFILLFSMSQIDQAKFDALSESFRNRMIFDFEPSPVPMENPTENTRDKESGKKTNEFENPSQQKNVNDRDKQKEKKEDSLTSLMTDIKKYLNNNNLNNVVSANRTDRGIVLVLQEKILFDTGEAAILNSGKPFLTKIGKLLEKIPNAVKVEGHTDNRPISNYRFPSNWELSAARASSVIRYLMKEDNFNKSRFTATGYAETRPVVPNTSAENWSKNRRVEIVILEKNETNNKTAMASH